MDNATTALLKWMSTPGAKNIAASAQEKAAVSAR